MKNYIGIDIGGMSIKAGVVNENGEILSKSSCETFPERDYKEIVEDIYNLCLLVIEKAGMKKEDIEGVGIGCPGTIWSEKGIIIYANNINFLNVPLVDEFNKHWNIPTVIDNDANCAALGETRFGSAKGYKDSILITLGTGVGSGIIIDGKIYSGIKGAGGEAGHMAIKINGERCTCGRKGCWEAYASATALIRQTKQAMEKNPDSLMHKIVADYGRISGRTSFEAAKLGDRAAIRVVKNYVAYIGCGLVNLVNIFRPSIIIVGGGISNEGEYFIKMIQRYVNRNNYGGKVNPTVKVEGARLLNDAGLLGAAALVI